MQGFWAVADLTLLPPGWARSRPRGLFQRCSGAQSHAHPLPQDQRCRSAGFQSWSKAFRPIFTSVVDAVFSPIAKADEMSHFSDTKLKTQSDDSHEDTQQEAGD